ncbi:M3 family oligoendopeptidase [Treponema phagedenis]|uniref:Oligoendopeptidase, M3 family n=1 Tax=Treponema phagedenis TaxID=162 RepID=A0A0B7GTG3_TREPH|nr:M3 family oligoendopeptidase [Treponema phagedenis]QEJ99726.1 M3 family oligoendopeptidase [Treponema phagedenis]QEK07346.1 M3 family oligoendopeptidase [Treponema phagedenis]QSH94838.1 M3 family oligoendopeptidase [Treponema phagedenis]QSI00404.1 M3 family oligoendopeptidase [Treponema phagedenis]TYT78771.1 M3 family oligoendopeptidase [Treponema phagedenis]
MNDKGFMTAKPMKKFGDMPYTRPDMKKLAQDFAEAGKAFESAGSAEKQIEIIDRVQQLSAHYMTMQTLAEVRHTINTEDSFYDAENDFFDECSPEFSRIENEFQKKFIASQFRTELEKEFGAHIFNLIEVQLKVFSPAIMDDLAAENKLTSKYAKLLASAQIEFMGKKRTLSQLGPFMQDKDRAVRKSASEAYYGFFAKNEAELDSIYDELVKVRTRIARTLGYKNYVQLGYDRLNRTDYTADMVAKYRKQIYDEIVPISTELLKRQKQRLGLDTLFYYDEALKYTTGNAVPQGDPDWIIAQAKTMYKELSPETDEFFRFMTDNELLDLLSKKGKEGGGYCTTIYDYQAPFIFANFNETQHDVEVMTHEAGHAFQAYQSRNARLIEYIWPTYEACEIHSMSMEFFTWPWMNLFFKHQTEKFRFTHLSGALEFLPYGVSVDEFQHWVYENPEASPAERKAQWRAIEKKYLPMRNYGDNDYLNRGGYWMRQSHIFDSPFYYIDYTLAQVCALQFWVRSQQNHDSAWKDYLRLCKAGGSMPFLQLVEYANLKNPFAAGCIASITPACKEFLHSIDDTKL